MYDAVIDRFQSPSHWSRLLVIILEIVIRARLSCAFSRGQLYMERGRRLYCVSIDVAETRQTDAVYLVTVSACNGVVVVAAECNVQRPHSRQ